MQSSPKITLRSASIAFSAGLLGAVTAALLGPGVVAQFSWAPVWVLPAVMCLATLLALIATALAFKLSTGGRNARHTGREE
jgi:ATP/ADP translocase